MGNSSGSIIHRENGDNQLMEIVDTGDHRSLYFASRSLQSRMSLSHPQKLLLSYTRYMLLDLPILESPSNILIIGIGAGSLIRFCHFHFPTCLIDAVDKSSQVIDLARDYFQLPESDQVRIHCREGYDFLQGIQRNPQFDLILVDAFDHKGMAETIYTSSFFKLCASVLKENGILSCNLWSGEPGRLETIQTSLSIHFPGQLFIPVPGRGNIIALAYPHPVLWQKFKRSTDEWLSLEQKFDLDFRAMLNTARRHNQNLLQRFAALFH